MQKEQSIKEKCFATIMKYLVTTLSTENNQLLDCEIDHNAENSLFWLNGRGFLKWTQPDDMAVPYQCHDKPFLQVSGGTHSNKSQFVLAILHFFICVQLF